MIEKLRIVGRWVIVIEASPPDAEPLDFDDFEEELEPELDPAEPAEPAELEEPPLIELELPPPSPDPPPLLAAFLAAFSAAALADGDFEVEVVMVRAGAGEELAEVVVDDWVAVARVAVPVEPPTRPTRASTWHLTVVFAALSTVPVSTTTTASGPEVTSRVASGRGGASHILRGLRPACHDAVAPPTAATHTSPVKATRVQRPPPFLASGRVGGAMVVRSRAMETPQSVE